MTANNNLKNPKFESQVATVACALHNICERHNCPFEEDWLPEDAAYNNDVVGPPHQHVVDDDAQRVRDTLADWVHAINARFHISTHTYMEFGRN